ncbi:N-acetyl-gamma-glutamyl-phosphate reductase [Salinimonas chungwhensis]|uniref:N-acetyl-gamma-glutamyl-phosphate reductase n=1 Tax=Salinimonas chungwhensis TaxID=265425 RepID=UPI00039CFDC9|nr:N-acetyl-gamma-glutamyl-phosphate reductase [Salinimonas chungwhensis]
MLKVSIIGASGYAGAQLVELVSNHPQMVLKRTLVSAQSDDAGKTITSLHPRLSHLPAMELEPVSDNLIELLASTMDVIFLATPHQASHKWVEPLSAGNAKVLDLSGAFRLKDTEVFKQYYGFSHTADTALAKAVYGLAEWYPQEIAEASVIAVPGCYPTAALFALKPLMEAGLLDTQVRPVINAVSGVSGAGRKASLTTSFYEVSLQAYGVLGHRHTPEIEAYAHTPVIFTPHLGNFKRGILATVTVKTVPQTNPTQLENAFKSAYQDKPLVRLLDHFPKVDDVALTPFVDVHAKLDTDSGYAVIGVAIDNVMKGAASQAIQCANLISGLPSEKGLLFS